MRRKGRIPGPANIELTSVITEPQRHPGARRSWKFTGIEASKGGPWRSKQAKKKDDGSCIHRHRADYKRALGNF